MQLMSAITGWAQLQEPDPSHLLLKEEKLSSEMWKELHKQAGDQVDWAPKSDS